MSSGESPNNKTEPGEVEPLKPRFDIIRYYIPWM